LDRSADADMVRAYCDVAESPGLVPSGRRQVESLLSACEAHNTIYRLAFSSEWRLPLETVGGWISDVERLLGHV
jgi:hypothetical protein